MRERAAPRHGRPGGVAGAALAAALLLAGPARADAEAATNGLVPLPCAAAGPLRPHASGYCLAARHYVSPAASAALRKAAAAVAHDHPGAVIRYMEASWPSARRPMPPHVSHGDGRQVDLAILYEDRKGRLRAPPTRSGYGAFEPPRREAERVCRGVAGHHARPDPEPGRDWRMAVAPTRDLIRALSADPRVRRIFVEPHLKARLGFADDPKVRFAGCGVARHDDHLHVDFR
ncbi:MAG: hypothetical protein AB1942_01610 [Pseudomonadota bacterium]